MTSTHPTSRPSPFRAAPPTPNNPAPTTPEPTPTSPISLAPIETIEVPSTLSRKWAIWGGIVLGLGCLSLIPLPHSVSGDAQLKSTPGIRQTITLPVAGKLQKLYVRPNQTVQAGQPIALIVSDELNRQIDEASINVEQSWLSAQSAKQQLGSLQAKLNVALVDEAASQQQADQLRQELEQEKQGIALPQVSELQSEIAGLQSEQAGLQANLAQLEQQMNRYEPAVQSGAISQDQWANLQQQHIVLKSQVQAKAAQIQAKQNEIRVVNKALQDDLIQRQNQAERTVAQRAAIAADMTAIVAEMQNRLQVVTQRQSELNRRQDERQQLVVQATTTGTVITDDMDLLEGQKLKEGERLLEIVNLDKLTVSVQIAQEDAALVKPGAMVKFRPRDGEMREYTAKVQEITPVVASDETHQKHSVTIKLVISNPDHQLQPGTVGYAHIETAPRSIAQRVQRELLKLFQPGRFL